MTRVIATPELDHFDPFLLLDEFRSDDPNDYIAGFPDHPHRGFEAALLPSLFSQSFSSSQNDDVGALSKLTVVCRIVGLTRIGYRLLLHAMAQ
jgi:hypothetical protein